MRFYIRKIQKNVIIQCPYYSSPPPRVIWGCCYSYLSTVANYIDPSRFRLIGIDSDDWSNSTDIDFIRIDASFDDSGNGVSLRVRFNSDVVHTYIPTPVATINTDGTYPCFPYIRDRHPAIKPIAKSEIFMVLSKPIACSLYPGSVNSDGRMLIAFQNVNASPDAASDIIKSRFSG